MEKLNVDKIYVVHYEKNLDRRAYLEPLLLQLGNEVEFCSYPRRSELTPELIDRYYTHDEAGARRAARHQRDFLPRMNEGGIAATISHFEIFKKAIAEIDTTCLILEDDVLLNPNFEWFNHFLTRTPEDWEAIFLGDGCNMHHRPLIENQVAYRREREVTRCADSIIYKKSLLEKIVANYQTFTQPIDWELELILLELGAHVYWWEPTLVTQGTERGVYTSNVR